MIFSLRPQRIIASGVEAPYYTAMPLDLNQIASREKEIAESIERLKQEASELAIAHRVFEKYSGESKAMKAGNGVRLSIPTGAPRPAAVPTTFEMTEVVFESAEKDGKEGLTSKELIDGIRTRFWPGLAAHQVLPTIYGFVKNERLHRTAAGKFKRPKKA
jgi:hypothetical protein